MKTKCFMLKNIFISISIMFIALVSIAGQTIQTPMGQTVYVLPNYDTPQWIAIWERAGDSIVITNQWDAERKGSATSNYNCHSYAWHVKEGGNSANSWLEQTYYGNPNLSKYWTNDAYTSTSTVANYEKIFYSTGDHSAVTTPTAGKVMSKWGRLPLYEHSTTQCPYNSSALVYHKLKTPSINNSGGVLCTSNQRAVNNGFTASNWSYDWSTAGYLSEVSGDGTPNYNVGATSGVGIGYVYLTVTSPSGMTISTNNYIGVKMPLPEDVTYSLYTSGGTPVSYMCPNRYYHIYVNNNSGCGLSSYTWSVPSAWTVNYTSGNMISVYTNSSYGGMVEVSANTCCGNFTKVKTGYFGGGYCGSSYTLVISPNPATEVATLSIEPISEEVGFSEDTEWDLEIFDQKQVVKEQKTKLKGRENRINTTGWKTGVYYVRVKYNNEFIEGKLLVK